MKIVQILGGLGNQMFQYAFYKALKTQSNEEVKIDISEFEGYELHNGFELDRIFNIDENIIATKEEINQFKDNYLLFKYRKKIGLLKKSHLMEEKNFFYDENLFNKKNGYFQGYWQSYKYFEKIKKKLLKDFKFEVELNEKNKKILKKIKNFNSCSIHVRRGDYLNHPSFGGICEKEYYLKSIKKIKEIYPSIQFFIFSNDIKWCKENLKLNEAHYIDWNIGKESYLDMYLMSQCKNNIIANSSFSWWGAWLNNNTDKCVIAPKKWVNKRIDYSLVPQDWLRY